MGDLVSFHDDIDSLGRDFTRAAARLHDALTHVHQASNHVRQAFDNHPDHADAAVAPFRKLQQPLIQLQHLVDTLGSTLCTTADEYRDNDTDVASGWERVTPKITGPNSG